MPRSCTTYFLPVFALISRGHMIDLFLSRPKRKFCKPFPHDRVYTKQAPQAVKESRFASTEPFAITSKHHSSQKKSITSHSSTSEKPLYEDVEAFPFNAGSHLIQSFILCV